MHAPALNESGCHCRAHAGLAVLLGEYINCNGTCILLAVLGVVAVFVFTFLLVNKLFSLESICSFQPRTWQLFMSPVSHSCYSRPIQLSGSQATMDSAIYLFYALGTETSDTLRAHTFFEFTGNGHLVSQESEVNFIMMKTEQLSI